MDNIRSVKRRDWYNCHKTSWGQDLCSEAYAHPAKVNRGLARKIYAHAIEQGWLKEGDVCLDPFAGICGFALDAMLHGLHWVGVELEQRFVDLGQGYDCDGVVVSEVDGNLVGARCGVMVEHDPHHVEGNIDLWNRKYSRMPRWGTARILKGDSRKLVEVLEGARAEGIIASPPYVTTSLNQIGNPEIRANRMRAKGIAEDVISHTLSCAMKQEYGTSPAQLGNMPTGEPPQAVIGSPPYAGGCAHTGGDDPEPEHVKGGEVRFVDYGTSDGQLAAMREGDVDAVIGSPPYTKAKAHPSIGSVNKDDWGHDGRDIVGRRGLDAEYGDQDGQLAAMREGEPPQAVVSSPPLGRAQSGGTAFWERLEEKHDRKFSDKVREGSQGYREDQLGNSDGQLGQMREGEPPVGIVSSPPWEASLNSTDLDFIHNRLTTGPSGSTKLRGIKGARSDGQVYGRTEGQLGAESSDTFWSAAKTILLQCHQVLAPGGVAIWVVKDFVRNKKRIDFTGQWRSLCESCGFETVEVIRAWLVEERGTQYDLDGEAHTKVVERKSFFRRLYEFNARAAKFWESITRSDKAGYLWHTHSELWQNYHRRLLEDESPPPLPSHARILIAAQSLAYREAGEPDVEIDTSIDYEVILVMRKAGEQETVDVKLVCADCRYRRRCERLDLIEADREMCPMVTQARGERAEGIVGSPPYVYSLTAGGEAIQPRPGDIRKYTRKMTLDENYGITPGQLAQMKQGDPPTKS